MATEEDDDDMEEEDSDDVLETLPAPFARGDDQSILEFFYPITIVVHNSTGALVVLAVPVQAPDLAAQALDLDPALVLAPTRAMAPPALLETETGDQPLDLPPPLPLLGAGAFLGPVWQEWFWEGLQVEPEGAWQAGSAMLSNLTGHLTTSSHMSPRLQVWDKPVSVILKAEEKLWKLPFRRKKVWF